MPIRTAVIEDTEEIVDLKIKAWKKAYQGMIEEEYLENMDPERFEEKLRLYFYDCNRIVYEDRKTKKIMGFCMYGERQNKAEGYQEYDSEICALYVDPDHKREGIGSKLILSAFKHLKQEKKQNTLLWCLKKNHSARHFYEAMGGILLGEKELYLNQTPYSEVGYGFSLNKILL